MSADLRLRIAGILLLVAVPAYLAGEALDPQGYDRDQAGLAAVAADDSGHLLAQGLIAGGMLLIAGGALLAAIGDRPLAWNPGLGALLVIYLAALLVAVAAALEAFAIVPAATDGDQATFDDMRNVSIILTGIGLPYVGGGLAALGFLAARRPGITPAWGHWIGGAAGIVGAVALAVFVWFDVSEVEWGWLGIPLAALWLGWGGIQFIRAPSRARILATAEDADTTHGGEAASWTRTEDTDGRAAAGADTRAARAGIRAAARAETRARKQAERDEKRAQRRVAKQAHGEPAADYSPTAL
jgi:hypothetical protein